MIQEKCTTKGGVQNLIFLLFLEMFPKWAMALT
jgi:hypothetical protein